MAIEGRLIKRSVNNLSMQLPMFKEGGLRKSALLNGD